MKAWHLVVLVVAVAGYLIARPPSGARIASGLEIDLEANRITYGGDAFTAHWGEPQTRHGHVRHVVRAHDRRVPIVLFHLVLATGDFSDPEVVTIDHNGGGNYIWRAQKQPEGSLVVVHVVPESELAFRMMRSIDVGDEIEIIGRDEMRGSIERQDGAWLRLGHDNHTFVLVSRVGRKT